MEMELKFQLQNETSNEEEEEDISENNKVTFAIKYDNEPTSFRKVTFDEEKVKWFTWPSDLANTLKHSIKWAKVKTNKTIDALRATQSMPPRIPTPNIIKMMKNHRYKLMMALVLQDWPYQFRK